MQAVIDLIHLDGYGAYVWPSFAVAAATLGWMAWDTFARLRGNERRLARLQKDRET